MPPLTRNLCIPCINVTYYSAVTKDAQSPYWHGRCDSADILVLKLRCNKRSAYTERPAPPSSKRRPNFQTHACLRENKNLCHGSQGEWSQKWLCWRRPAAILPTDRQASPSRVEYKSSSEAGCPRQPEAETVTSAGGVGEDGLHCCKPLRSNAELVERRDSR
jgi:hypothetical protein